MGKLALLGKDAAFARLILITYVSLVAAPILLSLYGWLIYKKRSH